MDEIKSRKVKNIYGFPVFQLKWVMTILHALVVLFTELASMQGLYFVFALSTFSILVCAIVSELNPPQQIYPG